MTQIENILQRIINSIKPVSIQNEKYELTIKDCPPEFINNHINDKLIAIFYEDSIIIRTK
jgi:hypothetical protein